MFDRNRGLALTIVISGSAVGMTIMPQLGSWLQASYGWRMGYMILGVVAGGVGLAAMALAPLPNAKELARLTPARAPKQQSQLAEILKQSATWKIIIAILALTLAIAVAHPNMAPMMADKGVSLADVAVMLSVTGIASWISRLAVGPIMDRVHAPFVAATIMVFPIIGAPLLVFADAFASKLTGAAMIGIALGGESDMISFITSRYFPPRLYSQAVGIMYAAFAWGVSFSHIMARVTFNYFPSYDQAILIAAATSIIGIPAILSLGNYIGKYSNEIN